MIARTLRFTQFTLIEYARSARILIELIASVIFFYIFLRRWTSALQPEYFFSVVGIFSLALGFYTSTSILSLGDRPQGYLLLARRLGRGGYLVGLYLAILAVAWSIYGLISLATAFYNPVAGLTLGGWVLGTVPLLLNVALLAAMMVLMAPMVLPAGMRLVLLALIAILSAAVAMPKDGRSLEDVTRELLRPLIKSWLDENLPRIVESAVEQEVQRIARQGG